MAALGATPEQIEEARAALADRGDECPVLPCNWPALGVFRAMETQWRMAPLGGALGLDYAAIPAVLKLMAVPKRQRRDLFTRLRTLERAALEVIEKRSRCG